MAPSQPIAALNQSRAGCPAAKRVFDVIFAAIGLVVISPAALLIAAFIKWEDGGSVFYKQERVGKGGKSFLMWKFRSMTANADKQGALITQEGDLRITRAGRVLRKLKWDELPQLWNVLKGEMSFVGPRPEVPRFVRLYTPEQRAILELTPGLTDPATVLFRNEESLLAGCEDVEGFYVRYCMPKKIELNMQYAARAGFFQDMRVITETMECIATSGLKGEPTPEDAPGTLRFAIIGTGEAAANAAEGLRKPGQRVVAFFDDNPRTWHKRSHNIPVAGMPECLLSQHWHSRIDEVIVALPKEDAARIGEIREMLKGLPLKVTFP
ncbi:MAG TPA: sugar transferase [Verrucomicrobiae bacterium]|jgi:lipopolysaccharide/colanic/teichoic acid biosynthesis glycosyltransferase